MEAFNHMRLHSRSTQHLVKTRQRLMFAGLLLFSAFLNNHSASSVSNVTSNSFCTTYFDHNENVETCDNVTIYDAIENDIVPFLEVTLNFTSSQLKTDVNDVLESFNDLYTDQTIGFVPLADLSVNNDVCQQKIGTKLSPDTGSLRRNKCPWEYKCDYDPRRIPQVMWQADCSHYSTWQCSCSDGADDCTGCIPINKECKPVYYPIPILYDSISSCNPFCAPGQWSWRQMQVSVACVCSDESAF